MRYCFYTVVLICTVVLIIMICKTVNKSLSKILFRATVSSALGINQRIKYLAWLH